MTWPQFYATVAAFCNRTNTDLIVNNVDLVMTCANMAKTEAQRRHNFKMARTVGFITPNPTAPGPYSGVNSAPDGSGVLLNVKKLEAAWTWGTDNNGYPARQNYIPVISRGDLKNLYQSINSFQISTNNAMPNTMPYTTFAYMQGTNVYVSGSTIPSQVWLDVIALLADYNGLNTDFFLSFHYDWLIMKTLDYLNLFMKEDQRVAVSQTKMEAAWNSVTAFDDDFQDGADDNDSLD